MSYLREFSRRNWRTFFILLSITTDALMIAVSCFSAYYLRTLMPNIQVYSLQSYYVLGSSIGAGLLGIGLLVGLFRAAYHSNTRQQYYLATKSYVYGVAIAFATFFVLQFLDLPRRFIFLLFFVIPFFFLVGRKLLNKLNFLMQKRGFGVHNALIVGHDDKGMDVFYRFTRFPELGYNVKGFVSKTTRRASNRKYNGSVLPQFGLSRIDEIVRKERIDRVFVPSTRFITNGYSEIVDACKRNRIKLKVLSPEADALLQMAKVYDIAGISLYSPKRYRIDMIRKIGKRGFDIFGSLLLLLILSPVFAAASLAILIESGSPVFFKQKRSATKSGKPFYFYKFRSMVKNADELKDDLFRLNESDGALFKIKDDPRMTRVGKVIRRYSIDELPQLFNVLRGEMSLVGPRPLPVADFEKVKEDQEFWEAIKDREKIKPGMTGLWQVSGRSNIGFREMILLDLYYIENVSLLFDLEILFATIPVVVFGKGAY
ncbi:MAG: sugar transferase [Ignavibacteriales bacterium]|nr:sugar transferase [Ignavibacteriales bacterium]